MSHHSRLNGHNSVVFNTAYQGADIISLRRTTHGFKTETPARLQDINYVCPSISEDKRMQVQEFVSRFGSDLRHLEELGSSWGDLADIWSDSTSHSLLQNFSRSIW